MEPMQFGVGGHACRYRSLTSPTDAGFSPRK